MSATSEEGCFVVRQDDITPELEELYLKLGFLGEVADAHPGVVRLVPFTLEARQFLVYTAIELDETATPEARLAASDSREAISEVARRMPWPDALARARTEEARAATVVYS